MVAGHLHGRATAGEQSSGHVLSAELAHDLSPTAGSDSNQHLAARRLGVRGSLFAGTARGGAAPPARAASGGGIRAWWACRRACRADQPATRAVVDALFVSAAAPSA